MQAIRRLIPHDARSAAPNVDYRLLSARGYHPDSAARDQAAEIGRADTRHYAKRQFTWFRHQLPEFEWVKPEAARGWVEARTA